MSIFYKNYIIEHYQETDSTNQLAFKLASANQAKDRYVIVADQQTQGKGRLSRIWQSMAGNLHFSLILQPKIAANRITELSFVAITALRLAVENIVDKQVKIENKWPNDLLINGKKVAGLLLESSINQNTEVNFVIIGIGLNLAASPNNPMFPASNLKDFGIDMNWQNGLEMFIDQFEKLYQEYLIYGFKKTKNLWLQAAYRLNERILVNNQDKQIEGVFEGIDDHGSLILKHDQKIIKITVAEVSI